MIAKIQRYLAPISGCYANIKAHFLAPAYPIYHQCSYLWRSWFTFTAISEWSVENETSLYSGISINNSAGTRVGKNPLVIRIERKTENGNIILGKKQMSVIKKLITVPRNQLLGGVITIAK